MRFISERISIKEETTRFSIVILGKIERWKESLLLFWLLAWTFSGMVYLYYFFGSTPYKHTISLLVLLMFWAYFELKIAKVFLWRRSGYEQLEFSSGKFTINNRPKWMGRKLKYDISRIDRFNSINRSEKNFFDFMDQSFWVLGGEQLSFNYNSKDIIFGKQIDDGEKKALLQILNGRLKIEKSELRKKERNTQI